MRGKYRLTRTGTRDRREMSNIGLTKYNGNERESNRNERESNRSEGGLKCVKIGLLGIVID